MNSTGSKEMSGDVLLMISAYAPVPLKCFGQLSFLQGLKQRSKDYQYLMVSLVTLALVFSIASITIPIALGEHFSMCYIWVIYSETYTIRNTEEQ